MTYQDQKNFNFVSEAYDEDTFSVVRFKGTESISRLYEFDITLTANVPDIDARSVLQNPATFTIVTPDTELPIYGIMSRFEQLQEVDENVFYRGVLVPRFWQSTLSHDNELFLEKNVEGVEFDGVIGVNDAVSVGVLKALIEKEIQIPDQIKVAGFGNLANTDFLKVPLTTVNQHPERIAEKAFELLQSILEHSQTDLAERVECELIVRESTGGE